MAKIGDRVGAILSGNEKTMNFLGYGIYEGDFIPQEAVGFIADTMREIELTNPRILLDNGKIVYGCECWWGSEAAVKKQIKEFKGAVIDIDIDKVRDEFRKHGE